MNNENHAANVTPGTTPPYSENGKFCARCGSAISAGNKFCPNCGAPMVSMPPENHKEYSKEQQSNLAWNVASAICLIIVPLAPIGIFLMWKRKLTNVPLRIIGTIIFSVMFLYSCASMSDARRRSASRRSVLSEPPAANQSDKIKDAETLAGENSESGTADDAAEEGSLGIFSEGDEIATKECTFVINEHKVIQPGEEGNEYGSAPVLAIWYTTTNTSGKEMNPMTEWILLATAIQDNNPNLVNELNVASLPDRQFLDTQTATIKKDGTVQNAVAYELSDDVTPVDIVFKNQIWGSEIGRVSIDIK